MPLYTIGYEKLAPGDLKRIVEAFQNAKLVDVRSRAEGGRIKRGFRRRDLEDLLGSRYRYAGDLLGGFGEGPKPEAIQELAEAITRGEAAAVEGGNVSPYARILMCQEEAPGDCHRHHLIALPLLAGYGIDARHICDGEVIFASELQAAIDGDRAYECEDLEEEIARHLGRPSQADPPPPAPVLPPAGPLALPAHRGIPRTAAELAAGK